MELLYDKNGKNIRKILAYFYFFRTFRILWVDSKGSNTFYSVIIPGHSGL